MGRDTMSRASPQSPRMLKRKRSGTAPLTPPLSTHDAEGARLLDRAVNVLSTAATALSQVTVLYQSDHYARDSLVRAVERLTKTYEAGGKLLICGVGKSGLVGMKMVATMKSLGLGASFLHASEALHGDLGDLRSSDAIMFVSFSGKTPELLSLLHHIPKSNTVLAITSHTSTGDCPLLMGRPDAVLLPAPIHEAEEISFGVCAPTTSTTVAIAVGDMLALTVAEAIHQGNTKQIFQRNHPGGSIGAQARQPVSGEEAEEEISPKRCPSMPSPD
ncbi:SIS domain-containing protein [Lindgomyces ingoldianus]|uniref:SIS domain-containing protein n=1 Tax=Lindgomyces ingoldianus TaxID=673940 RepID=A0ACB6R0B0_9PLEO|nr:SIS domain-containing protein [Lindgomyces ingoldianus]KAF2472586.1 SIS domain-containing protein [Lindgomyces ingoldianus]